MVTELTAEQVYRVCDPDSTGCDPTKELSTLETIVGQDRAIRAMQFGLGIKEKGFNIFVSGMPGTGRTTAVRQPDGKFEPDSVNARVDQRLRSMAETLQRFGREAAPKLPDVTKINETEKPKEEIGNDDEPS